MNSKDLRASGKAASSRAAHKSVGQGAGNAGRAGALVRPQRASRPAPPVLEGVRIGWREAIAATVSGLGFDVVEVERAPRGLLRITIDRQSGRIYPVASEFVLVEDCEQVTRQLQYALEVEGLEYSRLEVSSPGLDRPLKSEADYERFVGQAISLVLKTMFQGRKNWQGVLLRADALGEAQARGWSLMFKDGKAEQVLGFMFDEVREARLVPVVDFKGRQKRSDAAEDGQAGEAPVAAAAPSTETEARD